MFLPKIFACGVNRHIYQVPAGALAICHKCQQHLGFIDISIGKYKAYLKMEQH